MRGACVFLCQTLARHRPNTGDKRTTVQPKRHPNSLLFSGQTGSSLCFYSMRQNKPKKSSSLRGFRSSIILDNYLALCCCYLKNTQKREKSGTCCTFAEKTKTNSVSSFRFYDILDFWKGLQNRSD